MAYSKVLLSTGRNGVDMPPPPILFRAIFVMHADALIFWREGNGPQCSNTPSF